MKYSYRDIRPESLHHKTHKKCSIITSKFQLKILMDDLRKSPQFVKIHNWCEFLKCWNKIPKRCLLLSLTWRIFYNSEQIFYWEKYFLLSQKWSKEEYLCVHRVSSPFNWNLKLTFIEFTVATKRCFLTQKNSVVSHLSYPTTWEIDSQSWRLSQMFYTFRKKRNELIDTLSTIYVCKH